MLPVLALASWALAVTGLAVLVMQLIVLRRHLRVPPHDATHGPSLSILKPLCGVDDDLEDNLRSFAEQDYPAYEVLLGVRDAADPAYNVARAAAARWPDRFRVVLQRGAPGLNPKVNQLISLAAAARTGIFVISDSNVRVHVGYLREIAAELEDPAVGLVTHLIAGVGERRLGAALDNLQLCCGTAPSVVAAQRIARADVVVGKSMAMRRRDVDELGGFAVVKDVLAEDFILGRLIAGTLGKRVVIARRPVVNVSRGHGVGAFLARYERWSVIQRTTVGRAVHALQVVFNPVPLALAAAVIRPGADALAAAAALALAKWTIDAMLVRTMRPDAGSRLVLLAPLRDLLMLRVLAYGLLSRRVTWRGTKLEVLPGTRLVGANGPALATALEAAEIEPRVA